jgi:hypothetical protein
MVRLRDSALVWLVNVLTCSFWYWELDGGGWSRHRHSGHHADFIFPQATVERNGERDWSPHYIDYRFKAFNTSTAFPTSTSPSSTSRAAWEIPL